MAWYSYVDVRYRGRVIRINTRYGCFNGYELVHGKKLKLRRLDFARIFRIIDRHPDLRSQAYDPPDMD